MPRKRFGSVHPDDAKELTKNKRIRPLYNDPTYVVIPMTMHVGAPCKPIVAKGDRVLMGQKIAECTGLGAPIHSSVSGTVVAVEPRLHPCGTPQLSVVIENDFTYFTAPPLERPADPEWMTGAEIAELITEAGIVGLGGAGFPTGFKLKSAIGKVDTLIINGTECEPYITADHRLMLEQAPRIISGVKILMHALGLDRAIIGVETNKMNAIKSLRSHLGEDSSIQIVPLDVQYPQGGEKQLIYALTGRQVPSGKLPADVKCAVFNVSTAAAVHDAVCLGLPLTQRVVTVSGRSVKYPGNYIVPIGTPLEHILAQCGGLIGRPKRVLLGGPMMGNAQFDLHAPTIKATNALLFLEPWECSPSSVAEPVCIRCGRCLRVCPMGLTPLFFHQYGKSGRYSELEKFHIMDCMECGSCAYICPAHIPLVQGIRTSKNEIRRQAQRDQERQAALDKIRAVHEGKEDGQ